MIFLLSVPGLNCSPIILALLSTNTGWLCEVSVHSHDLDNFRTVFRVTYSTWSAHWKKAEVPLRNWTVLQSAMIIRLIIISNPQWLKTNAIPTYETCAFCQLSLGWWTVISNWAWSRWCLSDLLLICLLSASLFIERSALLTSSSTLTT